MDKINKHLRLDLDDEAEKRCYDFLYLLGRKQTKFVVDASNFVLDKYGIKDINTLSKGQAKVLASMAFNGIGYKGEVIPQNIPVVIEKGFDNEVKKADIETSIQADEETDKSMPDNMDIHTMQSKTEGLDPSILNDLVLFS